MNNCPNCGTAIPEGSTFCPSCGATVPAAPAAAPNSKKGLIMIVAAVVAVVLVIVLIVSLFSGGGAKGVADKFHKAADKANGKSIVKLLPDEYLDYLSDEYKLDEEEVAEYLTSSYEDMLEAVEEEYDDYKVSYKYDDTDDAKNSDIKDKSKMYDEEYGFEVDDIKYVDYESVVKLRDGDDKDTNHGNETVTVLKVNGKWRLDPAEVNGVIMSEYYEDKNK